MLSLLSSSISFIWGNVGGNNPWVFPVSDFPAALVFIMILFIAILTNYMLSRLAFTFYSFSISSLNFSMLLFLCMSSINDICLLTSSESNMSSDYKPSSSCITNPFTSSLLFMSSSSFILSFLIKF